MNKVYILAIFMIGASFTGCIEDEEESEGPKKYIYAALEDLENDNRESFCKMFLFEIVDDIVILANETLLRECIEAHPYANDGIFEVNYTINDYKEEKMDATVSSNSGPIYKVTMDLEACIQFSNSTEPWECSNNNEDTYFAKVNGQWIDITEWVENSYLERGESAPIATFFVEEHSGGYYYAEVIKVSQQKDLEEFSFFLKDDTGSTYVGGNGFGEIALQMKSGQEHGIETYYGGDDEQLERRADNISNDDGTEFPVHFSDNDRDGKLSAGDQFTIYGQGNSANGPAEEGWKIDIKFDPTGDIIGSAKLL